MSLPLQVFLEEAAGQWEVLHQKTRENQDRLADAPQRLVGKAAEAVPPIVGSVIGTILSFLGKAVGFVAEYAWTLLVFVVGLTGWWLM